MYGHKKMREREITLPSIIDVQEYHMLKGITKKEVKCLPLSIGKSVRLALILNAT